MTFGKLAEIPRGLRQAIAVAARDDGGFSAYTSSLIGVFHGEKYHSDIKIIMEFIFIFEK